MTREMRLNDEVKPGQRVAPEDLGQVRFALSRLGLFDPARDPSGEESLMGAGLRRALGAFQAGQGLREDATLRPRGPTEERLNLLLEQNKGLRLIDQDDALTQRQAARERTPGALVGRVGPGLENHPDDVATVGAVLRKLGHIKPGAPNPTKTGEVFGGLMSFQRSTGLAHDGAIVPDGSTERLLARSFVESVQSPQRASAPGAFEPASLVNVSLDPASELETLTSRFGLGLSNDSIAGSESEAARRVNLPEISELSELATRFGTDRGTDDPEGTSEVFLAAGEGQIPPIPRRKPPPPPPPPTIHNPTGGVERNDPAGKGWFEAPRVDKPVTGHLGVDIETAPGAPVVSPIDGTIRQRGKAYEKDERFDTVWIDGTGEYQGMLVKMFYVDRDGPVQGNDNGAEVKAGTTIVGAAQDRSQKSKKGSGMKPHVHVEVEWHGRRIDPATVLPIWESRNPN